MSWDAQERFPHRQAEISSLYLHNAEFRALCHDYSVCLKELSLLTESAESLSTEKRADQYRELQAELEQEIVEHLDTYSATAKGS